MKYLLKIKTPSCIEFRKGKSLDIKVSNLDRRLSNILGQTYVHVGQTYVHVGQACVQSPLYCKKSDFVFTKRNLLYQLDHAQKVFYQNFIPLKYFTNSHRGLIRYLFFFSELIKIFACSL